MANLVPTFNCPEVTLDVVAFKTLMFLVMASALSLSAKVFIVTCVKAKAAKKRLPSRAENVLIVEADLEADKCLSERHFYSSDNPKSMTELYEVAPPVMAAQAPGAERLGSKADRVLSGAGVIPGAEGETEECGHAEGSRTCLEVRPSGPTPKSSCSYESSSIQRNNSCQVNSSVTSRSSMSTGMDRAVVGAEHRPLSRTNSQEIVKKVSRFVFTRENVFHDPSSPAWSSSLECGEGSEKISEEEVNDLREFLITLPFSAAGTEQTSRHSSNRSSVASSHQSERLSKISTMSADMEELQHQTYNSLTSPGLTPSTPALPVTYKWQRRFGITLLQSDDRGSHSIM